MNDLEQRIRDLPRPAPSRALDERIAALLAPLSSAPAAQPPARSTRKLLAATAVAAGLAGFAAGIGTGHWISGPDRGPTVAGPAMALETPDTTFVQYTDARISAGLDFSQSLEPFRVQSVDQEGT